MKALKQSFALVILMTLVGSVSAQPYEKIRSNFWYFSDGAALDFTCGSPTSISGSNMTGATEGSATISDLSGNLLMYTNGETVWDRTHTVMPNGTGLMGDVSTVQPAVIVPHPGNSDHYFIFTAGTSIEASGLDGVRFSEVDMTLNGGNGDVLPGNKNTLLFAPNEEKLTAVRNASGTGYWVIAQEKSTNIWHAYEVTAAGVNMTPVTSTVGPPARPDNSLGAKFSPDGSMLVSQNVCGVGASSNANLTLYGFDNATGQLTYRWSDCGTPGFKLEFSPDNSKLYAAGAHCYQYDLSAGGGTGMGPDTVAVKASKTQLTSSTWEITGGMQLAPDCKIYFSKGGFGGSAWIGVIHNPNEAGVACNYTPNFMSLTSGNILSSNRFPNFVQSFFEEPCDTTIGVTLTATDSSICPGQCVDLQATVNGICNYTLTWSPGSFSGNGPHNVCPTTTTTYQVIVNGGGVADTSEVTITVGATGANAGNDISLSLCSSSAQLDLFSSITGSPDINGTWMGPSALGGGYLGTFDPATNAPGVYQYIINNPSCGNDTADVTITISPPPNAGADYSISLCGATSSFDLLDSIPGTPDAGGVWNGPSALGGGDQGTFDPLSNVDGTYDYVVTGTGGCPNDTASVTVTNIVSPNAGNDMSLSYCSSDPQVDLYNSLGGTPDIGGTWSGPSTLAGGYLGTLDPSSASTGTYYYIVGSPTCGLDSAEATITIDAEPIYNWPNDTTLCENDIYTITLPGSYTYDWDFGTSSANSYNISHASAGSYLHHVDVTNGQCNSMDSINITVVVCTDTLIASVSGDTSICEDSCSVQTVSVTTGQAPYSYLWSDGTTGTDTHTLCPSATGNHYVVVTDANMNVDTVFFAITVNPHPVITVSNDTTIALGGVAYLDAMGADNYVWTPAGDLSCSNCSSPDANPFETTTYSVVGTSNGCSSVASVVVTVEFNAEIFIPTAFSPNGDGLNDTYGVISSAFKSAEFKVFDRWGSVVFETSDLSVKWDGNIKGEPAQVGTYHYVLTGVLHNNETRKMSGNTSLIR